MSPRDRQSSTQGAAQRTGPRPLDLQINTAFERERTRDNNTLRIGLIVLSVIAAVAVLLIGITRYLPIAKNESVYAVSAQTNVKPPEQDSSASPTGPAPSIVANASAVSSTSTTAEATATDDYAVAVIKCEGEVASSVPISSEADQEDVCKCLVTANSLKVQGQADVSGLCVENFKNKMATTSGASSTTNDDQPSLQPADAATIAAPSQGTMIVGSQPPKFANFPATRYTGITAPLQLLTADDKAFRTRLRAAALQQVNFAGENVLTIWGCGTSCVTGAAVNLRTGIVAHLPFTVCCWNGDGDNMKFETESRLLVAAGKINEGGVYGAHFFEFKEGGFKEISTTPMQDQSASDSVQTTLQQ